MRWPGRGLTPSDPLLFLSCPQEASAGRIASAVR